ncbi:electron transfer flavoprotein subunit alpha/FixB family protein [Bdellovibrio svalbardensis]|uniref:Electron transfer flavoprotein subunit alpha/FixB family protein n=1 Tax=Bdellovibrio svalbardensis TaxID=2972972 RepID=A0ABT6DDJ4_9BACT|nr:electron transfer flavoprotein subunit alpha/FixB family protein [Bdellovibrio svalbardensis]MDG0814912.1 electron transfer flavoprotein subunit alpha/FixB family protein [Bdellovibrio svalbardensis]
MGKVLVFAEHTNGKLKRSSIELIQAAAKSGNTVVAVAFGAHAADVTAAMGHNGANEAHIVKDAALDAYNPESFTANIVAIINKVQPSIVLASASSTGKDLFPRVAARLNTGVASDCTELKISGDNVTAVKPMYSGKAFATVNFENSPIKIVLMRANQLPVEAADTAKTANVVEHAAAATDLKTLIKEIVKGASEKLDLTEANIIVSGGRGLKEAGNFKMLNDLADVLGATVGASRAVVDAGWVGHGMQVGQTGKTVAPTLYIAVGISGAIQHLAGMSGSKVIVAINNDANAPIFQKATYGIVGDAFDIVPKLTEEFKKALHH